jgi:2-iminobutanoate/2-iminopropanoate deaminase
MAVPLSPYRVDGDRIITSGQVGVDPATGETPADFEGQARSAFANLRGVLEQAGGTLDDVLKTTVFLVRRDDAAAMNAIYREHFKEPFPARSTIICGLVLPELLFEIEAEARI